MNTPEVWLPVVGYEEFYEVSNLGRVRSYHSNNHYPAKPRKSVFPRILKQGTHWKKGYKTVVLCLIGKKKKTRLVHQLVAAAFIGARPMGLDINHINGIKDDNCPENLEYVTRQENIRHKIDVLGKSRGEGLHSARLTEKQVIEIRELYQTNSETLKEIATSYGMHVDTIRKIIQRKLWKHVPITKEHSKLTMAEVSATN